MFDKFIEDCQHVITTTPSAKNLIIETYPLTKTKLTVIPHGRDFTEFQMLSKHPVAGEKIRVLVPGNITESKGGWLIKKISEIDKNERFEFHFLGEVRIPSLKNIGKHHGKYERTQFADKVKLIAPHLGVVLSIWPETYCHTLTEMWACGLPVIGIDLGAVGDRIRTTGGGWLLPIDLPDKLVFERMISIIEDTTGFQERIQAIQKWQLTDGKYNDTSKMAAEYQLIYKNLLAPTASINQ
jgi:glycosyltransferase involved in cell wall biosynthesis